MTWVGTERYRAGEPKVVRAARPRRSGLGGAFVRAAALAEILRPLVDELGGPTVAALAGVNGRKVWAIMSGEAKTVRVEIADDLITHALGDPSVWRTHARQLRLVTGKGRPYRP